MALDPSIALAYRPPQVNVDVPNPIQQFGQILSLRNMMQQGQAGQLELQTKMLQLQQIQQAVQERKNLADLFQKPQTQAPSPAAPPAASAPVETPAPEAPQYTPVAPYTPLAPPAVAPNTPATAAPAAGPALGAATVTDPFASLPSYSDILRAAPTTGAAHIETISKARKAYWENVDQQHKAQQDQWDALSTIAAGVHDEPSKVAGIAQAYKDGRITAAVRDQLMSHPYVKDEWDRFQIQALEGKSRGDEIRAQANQKIAEDKDAFDKSMRPYQLTEAQAKATEAGAKAKTATYGSVAQDAGLATDQPSWDTFRAGVPDPLRSKIPATYSPAAQQQTVAILGQTPEQQITTAATAKQRGLENVFKAVDTRIAQQKSAREENIYQQTYGEGANQALVGVEPKLRSQVSREVSKLNDDYLKAQAAADQFQSVLDLAKAGNKAAGSNLPVVGVQTMNALEGIRRIPRFQVEQYQGAGTLYDNIMGKIGKLTTGDPIPADVLKDMESMHNLLRQNSDSEYRSKLQSKNDIYHSNFQPVGRSGSGSGTVKMKAPDGTVRDIPSDQVDHYKSIGASVVQ